MSDVLRRLKPAVILNVLRRLFTKPDIRKRARKRLERIELVILAANCVTAPDSEETKALEAALASDREATDVLVEYLVAERYLFRAERRGGIGITPKGLDRLHQLQNAPDYFVTHNWFPVAVVVLGVVAIVADALIKVVLDCD